MESSQISAISPESLALQLASLCGSKEASFYSAVVDADLKTTRLTCEFSPRTTTVVAELPVLAKWLRVNNRPLRRPGSEQVIIDLPLQEQEWLDRAAVCACVPLVMEDELLAVICLHGPLDSPEPYGRLELAIHRWARGAARGWRQTIENQRRQQESAAAYRSQQLTTTGQMAASVAHEVRNPLAGVRSIVQLVKDTQPTPDRQAALLGQVLAEVDRIDHTVTGLLGLARPHQADAVICDLGTLTSEAVDFMKTSVRRTGIQLSFTIEAAATVWIDPRELRQVLLNVLLNACEACESGAAVDVVVSGQDGAARGVGTVRVRDSGLGVAPETLRRVFDPFFTTKAGGSGLGLAVSRDLVRKYGGEIRIESQVGVGTLVVIELPIVEPS